MDLRKVPGCHVYGGTAPLAAGVAKIPKERTLIFNVDAETEEALKDAPSFKVPFDKERPLPLECFDTIVKALAEEDDKTQCVFNSKDEIPATLGMLVFIGLLLDKGAYTYYMINFCPIPPPPPPPTVDQNHGTQYLN